MKPCLSTNEAKSDVDLTALHYVVRKVGTIARTRFRDMIADIQARGVE